MTLHAIKWFAEFETKLKLLKMLPSLASAALINMVGCFLFGLIYSLIAMLKPTDLCSDEIRL